jgi:hypothetical protein
MRLGFFANLKGADSLLLEGTSQDIALLSTRLGEFLASDQQQLAIHALTNVSARHPAKLFATRSASTAVPGFSWVLSPGTLPTLQGKLATLIGLASGHQYFELEGSNAQLMLSVGEYGESWWQTHA